MTRKTVFNLSGSDLSPLELDLLSRGLKFCPTYTHYDYETFSEDISKFIRRIKLFDYFNNQINDSDDDDNIAPSVESTELYPCPKAFKTPSTWTPKDSLLSPPVLIFTNQLEHELSQISTPSLHPDKHNLSLKARRALTDLSKRTDIVIRPADKGSGIVLLSREQYIQECERQLSDQIYYQRLHMSTLDSVVTEITEIIDQYHLAGFISKSVNKWIRTPEPRVANFYILPKIHKNQENPPGRPIMSANNHPTERISAYVDMFLNPIMQKQDSFIKDTGHLITILKEWTPPDPNQQYLIASLDVSALYTNLPHEEGLQAIFHMLCRYHDEHTAYIIRNLAHIVLHNNVFQFNGDHYTQIHGCAMGSRFSPSYACCFMAYLEEDWLKHAPIKPILYKRYIDDILIIMQGPAENIKHFADYINTQHATIKVTLEFDPAGVPFLDTFLTMTGNRIRIRPYTKKTDTKNYLHLPPKARDTKYPVLPGTPDLPYLF